MLLNRKSAEIFLIVLSLIFFGAVSIMLLVDNIWGDSVTAWPIILLVALLLTAMCALLLWYFYLLPQRYAVQIESVKSQQIVEMAAVGIVSIDVRGSIQTFNCAAQKIFGYKEKYVIGKNVSMLMPTPHHEQHDEYLANYLRGGEKHVIDRTREVEGLRKNGSIFPMELKVTEFKQGDSRFFTAMLRDLSEQRLAQQRIEQLAHFDELTHLPNRSLFFDRLEQAIIMAKRNQQAVALMYLDLDGFKQVNDTQGHHAGDVLLAQVAKRLQQGERESDTLARIGGDEFTLLLNNARDRAALSSLAQKLIDAIAPVFDIDGHEVHIGISIGIARYPDDAASGKDLLAAADKAMYFSKMSGKNTFRFLD